MMRDHRGLKLAGIAAIAVIGLIVAIVLLKRAGGKQEIQEARAALERRDFEKAWTILDARLQSSPGDTEAQLLAAQTARRMQSYSRAAKALRAYEQHGGSREQVVREERLTQAQSGDTQVAEELLRECEQKPGSAENYLALEAIVRGCLPPLDAIEAARGRVQEGPDLHRAIRAAEALLQTPMGTADRVEALFWSGRIHRIGLRHERGVADLRLALELDPNHFELRQYLANAIAQAAPGEAMEHMQILAKQRPDDISVQFGLASLHRALGQTDEAGRILDVLLRDRPNDLQLLLERAHVLIDAGRADQAELLLRRAVNGNPNHKDVLLALSKCLRIQARTDEADRYLKRYQELVALEQPKIDPMKPKSK